MQSTVFIEQDCVEQQKLRGLDHDLVVVFVHSHKIGLGVLQRDSGAIVLPLEFFAHYAPTIEHLHIFLIYIAIVFFEVVHLIDKEADLSLIGCYLSCI